MHIDRTEITNIAWKEFLYYNKNNYGEFSSDYLDNIPDTLIWAKAYPDGRFFGFLGKYENYTIVGVTKIQALNYCRWRSKVVSQIKGFEVIYELPTTEDYELIKTNAASKLIEGKTEYSKIRNNRIYGLCSNVSEISGDRNSVYGGEINNNNCTDFDTELPNHFTGFRCKARIVK